MKKFISSAWALLVVALVFYPLASVQAESLVPCGTSEETKVCTLCDLVVGFHNLTEFFLRLLVVVSLAGITIAGVMYMISGGSEKMLTQAKSFLKSSLIGFAVVLGAWLIVNVTMNILSARGDLGIGIKNGWNNFECAGDGSKETSGPKEGKGDLALYPIASCGIGLGECGTYLAVVEKLSQTGDYTATWTCAVYDDKNVLFSKADCTYTQAWCGVSECKCLSGDLVNCSTAKTSWTCKTANDEKSCP